MTAKISFFTSVTSSDHFLLRTVDSYFHLRGKKAEVIPGHRKGNAEGVQLKDAKVSWFTTALKVISYFSVVLPLIMFSLKVILRSTHSFYLIENEEDRSLKRILPSNSDTSSNLLSHEPTQNPADVTVAAHTIVKDQEDLQKKQENAAKKIQTAYRSFKERKAVSTQQDATSRIEEAAGEMRSNPVEASRPIISQEAATSSKSKQPMTGVEKAFDVCENSGYQYLTIQEEAKEELSHYDLDEVKIQIGTYVAQPEKFTESIKEFTGLLCQSEFEVLDRRQLYHDFFETSIGLYDRFQLYLEGEKGKIKLTKLNNFDLRSTKEKWYQTPGEVEKIKDSDPELFRVYSDQIENDKKWCFFRCVSLVYLFPHHLSQILEVARAFDPSIDTYLNDLQAVQDEALKGFELIYGNHARFLETKGITVANPWEIKEIPHEKKKMIYDALVQILLDYHDGKDWSFYKGFLGDNLQEMLSQFESSFPKILAMINSFLSDRSKKYLKQETCSDPMQLLYYRSLCFSERDPTLRDAILPQLSMLQFKDDWDRESFASNFLKEIFAQLANHGELAYYEPQFGSGDRSVQWIFY